MNYFKQQIYYSSTIKRKLCLTPLHFFYTNGTRICDYILAAECNYYCHYEAHYIVEPSMYVYKCRAFVSVIISVKLPVE